MGNLQGFWNRSFLFIEIGRIHKILKIIHSFIFVIKSVWLKKKQSLFLLPTYFPYVHTHILGSMDSVPEKPHPCPTLPNAATREGHRCLHVDATSNISFLTRVNSAQTQANSRWIGLIHTDSGHIGQNRQNVQNNRFRPKFNNKP